MTFEKIGNKEKKSDIVIDHFHSIVVEVIALLSSLYKQEKGNQSISIEKDLSPASRMFLQSWKKESTIDFIHFLNLLVPCPYFHDMELFVQEIKELSQEDYLYHFLGEELSMDMVKGLVEDPSTFITTHESIVWDSDLKRNFSIKFIENLSDYRKSLEKLLLETAISTDFMKTIKNKMDMIEKAMLEVKTLSMEPLTLAQYIMGKNFRRVHNYRMYYFIPSYFFTSKMRIFNTNLCMVFYRCASPLSDVLQQSKDLDIQLKAIADPNRLILLQMLAGQKLYGARLAEYLGITTATVSHHLDILKKADFISEERVGTIKYFTSNKENLNIFLEELKHFINV